MITHFYMKIVIFTYFYVFFRNEIEKNMQITQKFIGKLIDIDKNDKACYHKKAGNNRWAKCQWRSLLDTWGMRAGAI